MKIHSNLNESELDGVLRLAASHAGAAHVSCRKRRSQSHRSAVEVILTGDSPRSLGRDHAYPAASWDQWGIYLARLFEADPSARAGLYRNREHFHASTGGRYYLSNDGEYEGTEETLVLSPTSLDYKRTPHRWEYDYERSKPLSGPTWTHCVGHGAGSKRAECHAVRAIGDLR